MSDIKVRELKGSRRFLGFIQTKKGCARICVYVSRTPAHRIDCESGLCPINLTCRFSYCVKQGHVSNSLSETLPQLHLLVRSGNEKIRNAMLNFVSE